MVNRSMPDLIEPDENDTDDREVLMQKQYPAGPPTGRLIVKRDGRSIPDRFQNQSFLSIPANNILLISAGSKTGSEDKKAWR